MGTSSAPWANILLLPSILDDVEVEPLWKPLFVQYLIPLHPPTAALAVAFEFVPQSFGDAQIGTAPEAIHLAGEEGGELRGADHQQHLVVLMGGRGAPVERSRDHCAVVDHCELVVKFLEMDLPAWFLRDAQGAGASS